MGCARSQHVKEDGLQLSRLCPGCEEREGTLPDVAGDLVDVGKTLLRR